MEGVQQGSMLTTLTLTLSDKETNMVQSITLFVTLLLGCMLIGNLLEKNRWINESITTLFIGVVSGTVLLYTTGGRSSRILVFSENLFFIYLLPPIIFNAGFQVKKKQFFRNFSTIMLFGAGGTLLSFTIISVGTALSFRDLNAGLWEAKDFMALGAIFSATDSICTLQVLNQEETPLLYSLVFGEGVVNDATSVVLFNAIQKFDLSHISSSIVVGLIGSFLYLFATSTLLGVVVGLLSAYIIKKLYVGRHSTDREVALMMILAYLSYIIAELFNLSGILTVFFCGIVMSHYTWHNVTESSRVTTKHAFATMSFVSEIFIFLYVGMDALDIEKWRFVSNSPGTSIKVSSVLLCLILVGRAAAIFPLTFISNFIRSSANDRIGFRNQIVIWWSGLMRGAVSMALAYNQFTRSGHTQQPGNAIMITSTITVVLFSTVVFGLMTKPLINLLLSPKPLTSYSADPPSPKSLAAPLIVTTEPDISEVAALRSSPSFLSLLSTPSNTIHFHWRKFDDAIMRPVFGGRGFTRPACAQSSVL